MDLSLELPDISYETLKNIFILIVILFILYKFKKNVDKRKKRDEFTDINQSKLLYETFPIANHHYLDNTRYEGIVYKDYLNLPVLKCPTNYEITTNKLSPISTSHPKTYHDQIVKYMRHKVYPFSLEQTDQNDVLDSLQNGDLDVAIVNEEKMKEYIIANDDANFSVIGGLYYMDFFLIAQPGDSLDRLSNLESRITVNTVNRNGEPEFLRKLVSSYQFDVDNAVQIVEHDSIEEMIAKFMKDEINYMFLMCHPMDRYILDITVTKRIKLIHLKDHYDDEIPVSNGRTDLDVSSRRNPTQYIRKRRILPEDNMKLVGDQIIRIENHLSILKRYIPRIYEKVIDLNYFHETDNQYSYLETYSIKYLLVARNELDNKTIKVLAGNLVSHMKNMRNKLIKNNYIEGYFNHNNYDLEVEEMLVFDKKLNLHEGSKEVYEKIGLIRKSESNSCVVQN